MEKEMEKGMETENKAQEGVLEYKPLEVPEVVPGSANVDFPEINDFLRNMRIRTGLFGFQKEDVYEKMQKLNSLYQARAQQMRDQARGQLKQMKKQQQEEIEDLRAELEKEKAEAEAQAEKAKAQAEKELEELRAQAEEGKESRRRELELVREEIDRLIERLSVLKNKVSEAEEK